MRRLIIFALSFFFFFTFLGQKSYASDVENKRWVCLSAIRCDKPNSNCSGKGNLVHRVALQVKGGENRLLPDKETYIVEVIAAPNTQNYTTGSDELDKKLFGVSHLPSLRSKFGYGFEGLFKSDGTTLLSQPLMSNGVGEFAVGKRLEWQSHTHFSTNHKFFAVNLFTDKEISGIDKTQNQATFSFAAASKNCASIRWDPYGVVFDARTLEPVPNVSVILKRKEGDVFKKLVMIGVDNPYVTREDGTFNFVVPDGIYKLLPSLSDYVFPAPPSAINSNWKYIYSDLYFGDDIIQAGKIQHRDIPILPLVDKSYAPKVMELFVDLDKTTGETIIEGRVSHPFATVSVYSNVVDEKGANKVGRLLEQENADKKGAFKFIVEPKNLEEGESCCSIGPVKKIDLTSDLNNYFSSRKRTLFEKLISSIKNFVVRRRLDSRALASEARFTVLNPILNYIEGYAYDAQGKVIPNATVRVYLKNSTIPYYETKANENGFFNISSQYLPFMPYYLRYFSPSGKIVKVSTTKFLGENQKYASQHRISYFSYKSNSGSSSVGKGLESDENESSSAGKNLAFLNEGGKTTKKGLGSIPRENNKTVNNQTSPKQSSQNSLVVTIVILILTVIIAVSFLFYYLHSKKQNSNQID